MKMSRILIGIAVVIVVAILIYQQRIATPQALRVIEATELSGLKDKQEGPVLIRYSKERWRSITKDIATIKGPLSQTAPQLAFFPEVEPDLPPRNFIVRPRCPSPGPNYVCVPQISFGPRDELIFGSCICFLDAVPVGKGEDERERENGGTETFDCRVRFDRSAGLSCEGTCAEKGECLERSCGLVRSFDYPGAISCECPPRATALEIRP